MIQPPSMAGLSGKLQAGSCLPIIEMNDIIRTGKPQATAINSTNYKWLVVGMLWLVCFFNYADRQAIYSVFPKLKEEYGFDKVQLGLIGSAFMWVYAGGATFAGFVCDRFRRKDL